MKSVARFKTLASLVRSIVSKNILLVYLFVLISSLSQSNAAVITKSVSPGAVPVGGVVTWTLSALASATNPGNVYNSGTAWGGTWTNQSLGNNSWGVSANALWYAPNACVSEGNYPQYINTGVSVGDAEFSYDTQIPSIACQPQEDAVLIFRNVSCSRYFMLRLDHFLGQDGCPNYSTSKLFYDKVTPTGNPCGTPGVASGTFADGVGNASIDCVAKNTWYSMRVLDKAFSSDKQVI